MFQAATKTELATTHALAAATFVALDIETYDADDASIEAALSDYRAPGNIKDPIKIEARKAEAAEKIREKAALLDSSPISCIAVQTEREHILFSAMGGFQISGVNVIPDSNEEQMLRAFRNWLDATTNEMTELVAHGGRNFDLPKLRSAYIRHRLRLPHSLRPENQQPLYDTMERYKSYSMENRDNKFISLDTVCAGLGIDRPKQHISGAQVPELYRQGQYQAIAVYCCIDVAATARAYLLMTSQAGDLE